MKSLTMAALAFAVVSLGACKKTGEGEYEVQKPAFGTVADTVHTPTVDVGTKKDTMNVPTVQTKKKEVSVPTVDVKPPKKP
jgi:hypothetical protein